jgi:hypothetical protein
MAMASTRSTILAQCRDGVIAQQYVRKAIKMSIPRISTFSTAPP